MRALATTLHVPASALGIYGSAVYKPPDPVTPALVSGAYEPLGEQPACTVTVTDDRAGLFNPARYRLGDRTMLVSYRLGHAALFRAGDRLALPSLPCARFGEQVVRLVLRYEHIDIVSSREPHVDPVSHRPRRAGRPQSGLPGDRRHAHLQ